MKPTITVNQYPIGWEWLDRVPLEDFNWLIIDIFPIIQILMTLYFMKIQKPYQDIRRGYAQ